MSIDLEAEFGTLRAALAKPSTASWSTIVELLDAAWLSHPEAVRERWLPYLHAHLRRRWMDIPRTLPMLWSMEGRSELVGLRAPAAPVHHPTLGDVRLEREATRLEPAAIGSIEDLPPIDYRGVRVHPTRPIAATVHLGAAVCLWDVRAMERVCTARFDLDASERYTRSAAQGFADGGDVVIARFWGGRSGRVLVVWCDMRTGEVVERLDLTPLVHEAPQALEPMRIKRSSASACGRFLLLQTDAALVVVDAATGQIAREYACQASVLHPDQTRVLCVDGFEVVERALVDASSARMDELERGAQPHEERPIGAKVAYDPTGRVAAYGSFFFAEQSLYGHTQRLPRYSLHVRALAGGAHLGTYKFSSTFEFINDITLSPGGRHALVTIEGRETTALHVILDLSTGESIGSIGMFDGEQWSKARFTPDGESIVVLFEEHLKRFEVP
ncbi:MAG: hypothetical protein AAGI01_04415 [Myxococcota bacterium]